MYPWDRFLELVLSGQKVNTHIFLLNIAKFLSIGGIPFYIPNSEVNSISILFSGYNVAFHALPLVENSITSIDSERQQRE